MIVKPLNLFVFYLIFFDFFFKFIVLNFKIGNCVHLILQDFSETLVDVLKFTFIINLCCLIFGVDYRHILAIKSGVVFGKVYARICAILSHRHFLVTQILVLSVNNSFESNIYHALVWDGKNRTILLNSRLINQMVNPLIQAFEKVGLWRLVNEFLCEFFLETNNLFKTIDVNLIFFAIL